MSHSRLLILALLATACASTIDAGPQIATRSSHAAGEAATAALPTANSTQARIFAADRNIDESWVEAVPVQAAPAHEDAVAGAGDAGPAVRPAPDAAESPKPASTPAPKPGPVVVGATTLVRGEGPASQPAPVSVDGHPMLPVWDDAKGTRPGAVKLCWAQSEVVLNLYDPPRATPQQVEFSLDGGPWVAARYGRVDVPDLGPGTYQVRCVAYPSSGKSWVMDPIVLERTATGWRAK